MVLALIGLLITAFLVIKNVKGNILLGILITWVLGIICQLTGLYVPNAEAGFYEPDPPAAIISAPASVAPTLFKMDFSAIASLNFVVVVFAFLFVDIFDTLGTTDRMCDKGKHAGQRRQAAWHQGCSDG